MEKKQKMTKQWWNFKKWQKYKKCQKMTKMSNNVKKSKNDEKMTKTISKKNQKSMIKKMLKYKKCIVFFF